MYEQVSHALLNDILDELKADIRRKDLRHFYMRLGANFYAIHSLFQHLYGHRDDFKSQMLKLVERLACAYIERPADLKHLDMAREEDHNWFLSPEWVGMALLWDTVATKNAKLLNQGILSLPAKLDRATWLNYVRCHDDIGLGFDDADIRACGYEPVAHRRFLVDYFTGKYEESAARGQPFGVNPKTGDARISGSLASLAGLEAALEWGDPDAVHRSIDVILLHGVIMSFGGIPLLYYDDEIGTRGRTNIDKAQTATVRTYSPEYVVRMPRLRKPSCRVQSSKPPTRRAKACGDSACCVMEFVIDACIT